MKKIFCFFMVFMLVALLVVPCFAVETTVAPSDLVDWFGGGVTGYSYTVTSRDGLPKDDPITIAVATSLPLNSGSSIEFPVGTKFKTSSSNRSYVSFMLPSSSSWAVASSFVAYPWTYVVDESSYTSVSGTEIGSVSGSEGFVDSGVSDAFTELSIIVSAILSNQFILIAIGLAVAVPLVAWGISKIKSLVKGY